VWRRLWIEVFHEEQQLHGPRCSSVVFRTFGVLKSDLSSPFAVVNIPATVRLSFWFSLSRALQPLTVVFFLPALRCLHPS
jgi:hypothetical protein